MEGMKVTRDLINDATGEVALSRQEDHAAPGQARG
jgi:hypothetical protein